MNIGQLVNRTVKMEIENNESSLHNAYRKKKRFRSAFTTDQIVGLEKEYKRFPYIGIVNRKAIAKALNIPEKAVKIWFQNRRMKEKRDKTHNTYDETHNTVNLVNDQSTDSATLQSSNDLVTNSFPPQINLRTTSKKEGYNNFLKSCVDPIHNIISTEKTDKENKKRSDDIATNNVVTSSSSANDSNTTEIPAELLKNKNDSYSTRTEKSRQEIVPKSRHEVNNSCKYNTYAKISQQATLTSTSMPQRHAIPQIPPGYFPPYTQNAQSCYQQTCLPVGNVLWNPMEPNMASVMPMNQFAFMPRPTGQNLNIQGRKCCCNCHGSQQNSAYPEENHLPSTQYVFAVPFHNAATRLTYPI